VSGTSTISRRPRFASHHIGLLDIRCLVAGRETILHCQGIKKRLDGRTDLTSTLHRHIIRKMREIQTTDISFHMTILNTAANITANSAEVTGLVSTNLDPPSTIGTHFSVLFLYKEGSMSESEFKSWTIENMLNTSAPIKFAPYSYNIISGMSTGGSWTAQIKTNFPSKLNANTSYTVGAVAIYQKTTKDPVQYQYFFSNRMTFSTTN
ncbi:MAG: hypothetical protein II652_03645, partial [Bacteroidales bacterium]|nr:hypothetical protein [Bacteroidales bacterium]